MKFLDTILINIYFILISLVMYSCTSQSPEVQEPLLNRGIELSEEFMSIPNSMTNAWDFTSAYFENGEKRLLIYDMPKKAIHDYSLDQGLLANSMYIFSDTLDPKNTPLSMKKTERGYIFNSSDFFGLFSFNGMLIKKWDIFYPRGNEIKNHTYDFKILPRSSINSFQSVTGIDKLPIRLFLANVFWQGVFEDEFYAYPLFGELDLRTGILKKLPVSFPSNFRVGNKSYPYKFQPAFTGCDDGRIAYQFGIDNIIHIIDTETEEIESFKVDNPDLPVEIYPIDIETFNNQAESQYYLANQATYGSIYYNQYTNGFLRSYSVSKNGVKKNYMEILNEDLEIVSYFEIVSSYSKVPLIYPDEIWFPFQRGYKENEMKLLKVTLSDLIY
jgi:hypothetical protein